VVRGRLLLSLIMALVVSGCGGSIDTRAVLDRADFHVQTPGPVVGVADEASEACTHPTGAPRAVAGGTYLHRRWHVTARSDTRRGLCLDISWTRYFGAIFAVRRRALGGDLEVLEAVATSPPSVDRSVYVLVGYASARVEAVTVTAGRKTRSLALAPLPDRLGIPGSLFVHLFPDDDFGHDGPLRLKAGPSGESIALSRGDFFDRIHLDS
jgi:hypothetical protein